MSQELGYLEKIDLVRERTDLSFSEARNLLEESNWDLLQALAAYEDSRDNLGSQLLQMATDIWHTGNKTKIVVKAKEDTVLKLPVTIGILGVVLAPKVAFAGTAACLLARCSFGLQTSSETGDVLETSHNELD